MADPVSRLNAALSDRYRIERELGAGGMATVYLALDLKHDRKVALKVLKPELAAIVGADRFLAEIRTTANLQHPHILPLFDSGEADGFLFFVMPYVEGESLRDRLDREKQLPVDQAIRIATEVADALDHAHAKGVIHRDIKPANILLRDGRVQVADFGIALAVQQAGGTRLTETGLSVGTPHYMSPEQASGDRELDGRSDLYSLGCVLYEMLAGEPPHVGPTAQAILAKILTEEPRPLGELRPSVPAQVEAAVHTVLEKLPADRFTGAHAFAEGLANQAPMLDHTRTRVPRILRSRVGRRLTIGLAVASPVFALLALWPWLASGFYDAPGIVEYLPLSLSTPSRVHTMFGAGVAFPPSGARVAYAGPGGWWSLDLREAGSAAEPLGFTALHVSFSPSGDSVAFNEGQWLQQMYVMEMATGRTAQLIDSVQGPLHWAGDGWIYYGDQRGSLLRVRVSDRARETLLAVDPSGPWRAINPAPVPGAEALVYTRVPRNLRAAAEAEIAILDLRKGEAKVLAQGVEAIPLSSGHLLVVQDDGTLLAGRFSRSQLGITGTLEPILNDLEVRRTWSVGVSARVSADGTFLYVQARPLVDDTLVSIGRDGGIRRVISTWGGTVRYVGISPAGDRWAATVHRGITTPTIFLMEADDSEPRRLTFGEVLDYSPQFIPFTDEVAFVSPRSGRNWDLYSVPVDEPGASTLLLDRPGDIRFPRFTADGNWVVFCEQNQLGEQDVVAHRLRPDSITEVLIGTGAQECNPDVSPDGRWIAFTSNETGSTQVYIRGFRHGPDARWQLSSEGGTSPRWSRSGRELFFMNEERQLVAVSVASAPSLTFGSPRVLFTLDEHSSWSGEITADDEFIVIRSQPEASGQVVLIRNFFELLKERVGLP